MTPAGLLTSADFILNLISPEPPSASNASVLEIFANICDNCQLVITAASENNARQIALLPLGIEEDLEVSLLAMAHSMRNYLKNEPSIEKILICYRNIDYMKRLKGYFLNGYDVSMFQVSNETSRQSPSDHADSKKDEPGHRNQFSQQVAANQKFAY
jgi:hypothetical protein